MGKTSDLLGSLDSFGDFVVGSEVIGGAVAPGSSQEVGASETAPGAGVSVDEAQGGSTAVREGDARALAARTARTAAAKAARRATASAWLEARRAPEAVSIAVREVRALPAGSLAKLPASWALHCEQDGVAFVVTNSRAAYRAARESRAVVFLGGEWYALAHAAQNDRAWARELREWLRRKTAAGEWRLTHAGAFAGMEIASADALVWNVGDVLDRVDATLVRVEVFV